MCGCLLSRLNNIDLFAAGMAETPLSGARLGPTFACIIGRQLKKMLLGDRFFYAFAQADEGTVAAHCFTHGRNKTLDHHRAPPQSLWQLASLLDGCTSSSLYPHHRYTHACKYIALLLRRTCQQRSNVFQSNLSSSSAIGCRVCCVRRRLVLTCGSRTRCSGRGRDHWVTTLTGACSNISKSTCTRVRVSCFKISRVYSMHTVSKSLFNMFET